MNEVCSDNRFEVIRIAKERLLAATNIDTSPDEMKVLDNFLFRCWQMGWLDRYEKKIKNNVPEINVGKWIPCSEKLPENEQTVEITFVRKRWKTGEKMFLTARAFYTDGTTTTEESDYVWEETDNWEYDEEKESHIIPEGWWESVTFSEQFDAVDTAVIAWRPLPEPYIPEELHCGSAEKGYIQLLPGIHKTDGFFLARLKKES